MYILSFFFIHFLFISLFLSSFLYLNHIICLRPALLCFLNSFPFKLLTSCATQSYMNFIRKFDNEIICLHILCCWCLHIVLSVRSPGALGGRKFLTKQWTWLYKQYHDNNDCFEKHFHKLKFTHMIKKIVYQPNLKWTILKDDLLYFTLFFCHCWISINLILKIRIFYHYQTHAFVNCDCCVCKYTFLFLYLHNSS